MGESTFTRRGAGGGASVIKYTNAFTNEVPVYSDLTKTSDATSLSVGRGGAAYAKVGSFALIAGGFEFGGSLVSTVDAYDTSLTRSVPTALTSVRGFLASASVGNFALFAGGISNQQSVNTYNTSLTRSTASNLFNSASYSSGSFSSTFALFAGGEVTNLVTAYNTGLTRTQPTNLSLARGRIGSSSVNNHFVLIGGRDSNLISTNVVDIYDDALTRLSPTTIPETKNGIGATSIEGYALFAGGRGATSPGGSNGTVYVYDGSLTRTTTTSLSFPFDAYFPTSVSLNNNLAIFGVGWDGGTAVNTYNTSLTRYIASPLSTSRIEKVSGAIGNYAFFTGGRLETTSNPTNQTEVYTRSLTGTTYQLVTPELSNFNITYKYDFNTIGTGTASEGQTLSSTTTFTGTLEFPENIS
jgi:hypothetical protein